MYIYIHIQWGIYIYILYIYTPHCICIYICLCIYLCLCIYRHVVFGVSQNRGCHLCVAFYWGLTKADDVEPIDLENQIVRQARIPHLGANPLSSVENTTTALSDVVFWLGSQHCKTRFVLRLFDIVLICICLVKRTGYELQTEQVQHKLWEWWVRPR